MEQIAVEFTLVCVSQSSVKQVNTFVGNCVEFCKQKSSENAQLIPPRLCVGIIYIFPP